MNNGKRSINISLGGNQGSTSSSIPFNRSARPGVRHSLGFDQDDDDDNGTLNPGNLGPPKRKLIKLDREHDSDDDDDDALSRLAASNKPPGPIRAPQHRIDDDEDDAFSKLSTKKGNDTANAVEPSSEPCQDEEEDDPLDAFMADIDTQVQKEAEKLSEAKGNRDDFDEEDHVESYMKHMQKKGIHIGQSGSHRERNEDIDSDEEVYATARAIDNASETHEFDVQSTKKEITPLPRMDHSKQDYDEIEKCFYEEHEDIAKLTEDQVRQIRRDLDMRVSGADVAKPCISFAHFGFEEALMETIRRAGYSEPSGIQRQAMPVALSGRDIIGIAKTGSGKTAAFLLPMIVHIMDQDELEKRDGPIGVVLAPTRELAEQIYSEAKRFAKAYGLRVAVVYGGASKQDQFKALRAGVEIVVATPGRLIDMIKMKATNFRRTSYLVLDEADRVFDLGFEPQVRSICDNIRPDRQTLLFSATFQKRVEKLAREVMTDPVRISIGNVGQINSDVTQIIEILKDDGFKWNWLMTRLDEFVALGSVLIFVGRKNGVVELTENLKKAGIKCECLHGDMQQYERDKAVHDYKHKVFPTLIATDVAARGLDIKSIRTVVNYDVARDIDSHVHRVGRTGRAGEKGTAFTLITEKDDRFAGELVRNLEEFGQAVDTNVLKIAMQNSWFRKSRQFIGGRGGRGSSGGGRGARGGRGSRGRGGGGGRGGRFQGSDHNHEPSYSHSSNSIPLGQNARGDRRWQESSRPDQSNVDQGRGSSGYHVSGFQKASRPETGANEPISAQGDSGSVHSNEHRTTKAPAQHNARPLTSHRDLQDAHRKPQLPPGQREHYPLATPPVPHPPFSHMPQPSPRTPHDFAPPPRHLVRPSGPA
ncbi:ATP-dependent RNA helicase ddx42, partial [Podila humilis]